MPKVITIIEDPIKTKNLEKIINQHKGSYKGTIRCHGIECDECYYGTGDTCRHHDITTMKKLLKDLRAGKHRKIKEGSIAA